MTAAARPSVTDELRIVSGSVSGSTCILGLISNVLVIIAIYQGRKSIGRIAYYVITAATIAADIQCQIVILLVHSSSGIAGFNIWGNDSFVYIAANFMQTLTYRWRLYFTFLLTINRLTVFLFPDLNEMLFNVERKRCHLSILVWAIFAAANTAWENASGCKKVFNYNGYFFAFSCAVDGIGLGEHNACQYLHYAIPIAMFLVYVAVILHISKSQRGADGGKTDKAKRKREMRLLLQSGLICGASEVEAIVFTVLPNIYIDGYLYYYAMIFQGLIMSLDTASCSFISLLFNEEVQTRSLKILRLREKVKVMTVTVAGSGGGNKRHPSMQKNSMTSDLL